MKDIIRFTHDELIKILPNLPRNSHKGSVGRLLCVAGSRGMTGAACLCVASAMRAGCGYVTAAIPESIYPIVAVKVTEAVLLPLKENKMGSLLGSESNTILERTKKNDTLLIGCGISVNEDTKSLMKGLISASVPMLIDADGINIIASNINILKERKGATVLTPHSGEMARLTGLSIEQVEKNRADTASSFAKTNNTVVVLKGPKTLIASPDGRIFVNTSGNPGMATAGSGDVLSGIIGAFLAKGIDPFYAAAAGVFVHGMAGDIMAKKLSQYSLTASDIIMGLPGSLKEFDCLEE